MSTMSDVLILSRPLVGGSSSRMITSAIARSLTLLQPQQPLQNQKQPQQQPQLLLQLQSSTSRLTDTQQVSLVHGSVWRRFSTATATAEEKTDDPSVTEHTTTTTTTPNSKSRLKDIKKDPIILTERAAERIQELLSNQSDALGIRLGVKRRGCNGLSYTLNYAHVVEPKDISMEAYGVKIWIEPMALFNIIGTQMDWEETELTSEFTFHNPNSKGSCGCGESFNV